MQGNCPECGALAVMFADYEKNDVMPWVSGVRHGAVGGRRMATLKNYCSTRRCAWLTVSGCSGVTTSSVASRRSMSPSSGARQIGPVLWPARSANYVTSSKRCGVVIPSPRLTLPARSPTC